MRYLLVALALAAGCKTPDLTLVYRVADGAFAQSCGTTSCEQVPMQCESVLSVRVLSPADPTVPYISLCQAVEPNNQHNLCAIGRVNLPVTELPREILEVQVTVWPKDAVTNPDTGELDCLRTPVTFDAALNFPISGPAFGGRAFYYPDDTETVVLLGCTDQQSINAPSCSGIKNIEVTATVLDFENLPFTVSDDLGDRLTVSVGEPRADGNGHSLNSADSSPLLRTGEGATPVWGAGVDLELTSSICTEVLEDGAQSTTSLHCIEADDATTVLDLPGIRMSKPTLDEILAALDVPTFPEAGMTIGVVLDPAGNPIPNAVVGATAGSVLYLDEGRIAVNATATSSNGIFVSLDAGYGATFNASHQAEAVSALGGRVRGKVTIVMLQFGPP
jgi:hypothetical protein